MVPLSGAFVSLSVKETDTTKEHGQQPNRLLL